MPETAKERNARELAEFRAADERARAREEARAAAKQPKAAKAPASPFKQLEAAKPAPAAKGIVNVIHDRNARLACADADDVAGCVTRLRQQQTSDSSN